MIIIDIYAKQESSENNEREKEREERERERNVFPINVIIDPLSLWMKGERQVYFSFSSYG